MMHSAPSAAHGAFGAQAMIASGHPQATWAAMEALHDGGTAVDAAVAADAVLGVVEPMATGVGGDLMALIIGPDGAIDCYNGSGRSPAALTEAALSRAGFERIPERSPWSVTVPGAVQGWDDLHRRYGRLPLPNLLDAAIRLAQRGFPVARVAAREWALFDRVLHRHPETARLYRAGTPPAAGTPYGNPELARTLATIAEGGAAAFYRGSIAAAAAQEVQRLGGVLDASDFARHAGEYVQPLRGRFRGTDVLACPPNTHGGAVIDALRELDRYPLDAGDPETMVAVAEAIEHALETAQATVADPGNTVCTVVVDRQGLGCVLMSSVFKRFGSGIAVAGHGFVLQNRAFGFASLAEVGHPNRPAPRRRPYHTVIPGAALRDGALWAALGVVGGLMQPQGQVQLLVRLAACGEPLQAAIDAPRMRWEAHRRVAVESGMPNSIERALHAAGFTDAGGEDPRGLRSDFGGAQVVLRTTNGWLGGSDSRKDGVARGF